MSDVHLFTGSAAEIARLRGRIVQDALSWVGTPFHDCSGVKGAGCDCVHLLWRVGQACGIVPPDLDLYPYGPQWFQHRDEPRFLLGLEGYAHRIEAAQVDAGDFAMFNFGRHAAHAGIIIDENSMVHAYKPVGRVTVGDRHEFGPRLDSYWSLFA